MRRPIIICNECGQVIAPDREFDSDRIDGYRMDLRRQRLVIFAIGVLVFLELIFR